MNKRFKSLVVIIGTVVIAGLMFRHCASSENKTVLIPAKGSRAGSPLGPPSHARAKSTDPVVAMINAFKTPIELYGKVVDQHGDPVLGATVTLSPIDVPFADQSHSVTVLTSDAIGGFSIKGLHGVSMNTSVTKDGYLYLSPLGGPASSEMVEYGFDAKSGARYSNPATPLVLTLHKIGITDPMMYVDSKRWQLPVDGTVRRIALDSEKGTGSHQIEFRFKTGWVNIPDDNEHFGNQFDWSFEARIPGGGFIWCDNDYNFEAPENGYKEKIRLEYTADMPKENWNRMLYGSFFVKFADGSCGRIRFSVDGMERDRGSPLMLTSWLNLKPGSRNLATPNMMPSSASDERYRREWKW